MSQFTKDPQAELDYSIDWSKWLPDGDSVTEAAWTVPDGLTQPKSPTLAGGRATVWLGGGTVGQVYAVTCRVTTAQGRIDDRTVRISVRDR